jgi:hypothetical protein
LNYTCRTSGKLTDEKLEKYRDYLYHADHALSSLSSFIDDVFRGTKNYVPDHVYKEGATITFQQLSSASQSQMVAKGFLKQEGKKLLGTMFRIGSLSGKLIEAFSAFPEEKEVLFKLNSHFKVLKRVADQDEKKNILMDLTAYDMSDLDLYLLKQI